jgi:hypothetical protein
MTACLNEVRLEVDTLQPLIPAKAGTQQLRFQLDSGLRRNDGVAVTPKR